MALDFTSNYDLTFSGVGAWEMYDDGYSSPFADNTEDVAMLRIPGSDTTVVQAFGRTTREFSIPIAINTADIAALAAKRNSTGTLVRSSGASNTAYFVGLTNARIAGAGLDVWRMTLKFIAV
jgi:hypothetical protein